MRAGILCSLSSEFVQSIKLMWVCIYVCTVHLYSIGHKECVEKVNATIQNSICITRPECILWLRSVEIDCDCSLSLKKR
jgi:hypothetical protein